MEPGAPPPHRAAQLVLLAAALAVPALIGLLLFALLSVSALFIGSNSQQLTDCSTPFADSLDTAPLPTGTIRQRQIANIRLIEKAVHEVARPPRVDPGIPVARVVFTAAVAAAGESDFLSLTYGDRAGPDSRGPFQQRSNWGTLAQRMNPYTATKLFLLGPHMRGRGGLLDEQGWEKLPTTVAVHRVQINANPDHYTKFISRARQIAGLAGVIFTTAAPADARLGLGCSPTGDASGLPPRGDGPCPLDGSVRGQRIPRSCTGALSYLQHEMTSGSRAWRRRCMVLVAVAYGWRYSGNATAYVGSRRAAAAGLLSRDTRHIPRGAVLYWDGRATGNAAGHVAVYDGEGYIYSNDVTGPGRVGRVPWTFPVKRWHQRFLGWSPPYFPKAG
jgi:hypothetical protein